MISNFSEQDNVFAAEINGKAISVSIRKSLRARNIAIKINVRGKAELVLPKNISFDRARPFLIKKLPWLAKNLASMERNNNFQKTKIPIFGKDYLIKHVISEEKPKLEHGEDFIEIKGSTEQVYPSLVKYLKNLLLNEIKELVEYNSEKYRLKYTNIRLGKGVSSWGSCSRDNRLSFNWRLVFAPYNVLQYLVAHEMAHIKEKNHSAKFWKLVNTIYPESDIARKWLKKEGRSLYHILSNH